MEPPPRQRRRITAVMAAAEEPTTIHDVPDDLLRLILLRLDSPLWLVRAASASKPLRRAVLAGGRAFLRLAASLHPPVVIGHYHEGSVRPITFVPSSSPPPPIDGGRFALDFLYLCVFSTAGGWHILREPADGGGGYKYMGSIAGRVEGSIYLGLATGKVKVLDNASLELSEVNLPIGIDTSKPPNRSSFTVVDGAGLNPTSPAMTRIIHVHGEDLEVFQRVRDGEWVLEHSIAKLSEATHGLLGCRPDKRLEWTAVSAVAVAVGIGIAILSARDRGQRKWLFSVDVETKELKVVAKEKYRGTRWTFAYTLPWRQFLRASTS